MDDKTKQTISTFSMIAFFLVLALVIPGFVAYGKGGFNITSIFQQFAVYGWPLVGSFLAVLIFFVLELYLLKEDDKKYGNFIFFNSPGEGPSVATNKFKTPLKLFLISLIIFTLLGLIATFFRQTYFGVGVLGQQFTLIDGIIYNIFLVCISENITVFAFAIAGIFGLRVLARKYNWGKVNFLVVASIVTILLFVIFGYVNHLLRYSGQEQNLMRVVSFWGLMGLITVVTGSFIPAWVMHSVNNVYVEIPGIVSSNEILAMYVVVFVSIISIIYYFMFMRKK